MSLTVNAPAPDFTATLDDGSTITLSSLKGKKVILYFYPKDDTPGCTTESCSFRDNLPNFTKGNALVYGVSKDSVKSHVKFREKYGLTFPLISDESTEICQRYGVWTEKSMMGKKYMGIERTTFLIDENGVITRIWNKVKVDGHVEEVLAATQS